MRILTVLLLLAPALGSANPEPWMLKGNPNELFVNYGVSSACPFSVDSVQKVIDDVLVQSRIQPVDQEQDLNLMMDIQCKALPGEMYSTMLTADFYRVIEVNEEFYWARLGTTRHAARFGTGGGEAIVDATKKLLEDVITDYLGANSDPGE